MIWNSGMTLSAVIVKLTTDRIDVKRLNSGKRK